ncbi:hypothetical protein E4U42_001722 [Claviceps africana]|uniref:Uncharacterized protein n=1 Tax=Claviceps africana TaxID=83212 RepID=A0A8K0J9N0_9HYPO|nr:hypothetical protein E4U42_001722 [Claviceps africana]
MNPSNAENTCHTLPHSPAAEPRSPSIPTPESSSQPGTIISNHEMPSPPSTCPPRSNDDTTQPPDQLLDELTPLHDDLRTWLDHTGFWDASYRRGILADVRRLQGLDAERATVLMRIRDSKPADDLAAESAPLVPVTAVALQARRPPPAPARAVARKGEAVLACCLPGDV